MSAGPRARAAGALLGAALALGAPAAPAQELAGEVEGLRAMVEQLARQVHMLERRPAGEGADPAIAGIREALADQERRLRELEDTVRASTGLAENNRHAIERLQARIDGAGAPAAPAPQRAAGAPAAPGPTDLAPAADGAGRVIPDPTVSANPSARVLANIPAGGPAPEAAAPPPPFDDPGAHYKRAYDLLARADYAAAEEAFRAFINDHPENPLTDNAYYWLGETYYVRSKFDLAAASFARGFQAGPDKQKAPDMLLKLGLSLVALGKNEDACSAFQRLETEYPEVQPRARERLRQGLEKAGCG